MLGEWCEFLPCKELYGQELDPRLFVPLRERVIITWYGKAAWYSDKTQFSIRSSGFVLQTPDAKGLNSSFAVYHLYGHSKSHISHLIFVTCTTDQYDLVELFLGLNEIRCMTLNGI